MENKPIYGESPLVKFMNAIQMLKHSFYIRYILSKPTNALEFDEWSKLESTNKLVFGILNKITKNACH